VCFQVKIREQTMEILPLNRWIKGDISCVWQ
jgi:hypothetical protein